MKYVVTISAFVPGMFVAMDALTVSRTMYMVQEFVGRPPAAAPEDFGYEEGKMGSLLVRSFVRSLPLAGCLLAKSLPETHMRRSSGVGVGRSVGRSGAPIPAHGPPPRVGQKVRSC